MKKSILVVISIFIMVASCSKSSTGGGGGGNNGGGGSSGTIDCTGVSSAFGANVNPIIQSTCATDASCHGTGSANGPGPLTNWSQISGAAPLIKTAVANGTMPKTGTLTTAQKNSILCWIQSGAPNN